VPTHPQGPGTITPVATSHYLSFTMSLPLTIRKNIRDSEPKLKESLEKIQNVTGKEWSFEVDWAYVFTVNNQFNLNIIIFIYLNLM
jgi:hypothetical protein